jgi:uncharacterized protein YdeI (YjbR/CyaY-like superfamily)
MSTKAIKALDIRTRLEWRKWLEQHCDSEAGIWLVFHKRHTNVISIGYEDAVEEALCFGWIDSIIRRLDDERYVQKFTPRKPNSRWSTLNLQRYADLKSRGLLAAAGLERGPTSLSRDAPKSSPSAIPSYIEKQLKTDARAWQYFKQLAPSYRQGYIGWIESAKREETKEKRLHEVVRRLGLANKLASTSAIPSYIEKQLKTDARAWQYFERLAPSYRRAYIQWIESAERQETKEKRLRESVKLLAACKKLGLK